MTTFHVRWFVLTPTGAVGPFTNAAAARVAAGDHPRRAFPRLVTDRKEV